MTTSRLPVIAIDGPAASGKSSTAREVARRLGLLHIDSGSLYRTAALIAERLALTDEAELLATLEGARIEFQREAGAMSLLLEGEAVEPAIRSAAVTARVSEIAAMPTVRHWVDQRLRRAIREAGGAVMDGRDIGTVVFPDAALKVFLTASPGARAERRLRQEGKGVAAGMVEAEARQLAERDRLDAGRSVAPLVAAHDALHLDTSELGFEEQVGQILIWAAQRGLSAT